MGKQIGGFIRQLREERGLSQGDVAKLLNLKTAQSISNIERGVSPLPKAKIKRLAGVLGVEKGEIVTIVLREMQDRYSKDVGGVRAVDSVGSLDADERELVAAFVETLKTAKQAKRVELKKQIKKLLTA